MRSVMTLLVFVVTVLALHALVVNGHLEELEERLYEVEWKQDYYEIRLDNVAPTP